MGFFDAMACDWVTSLSPWPPDIARSSLRLSAALSGRIAPVFASTPTFIPLYDTCVVPETGSAAIADPASVNPLASITTVIKRLILLLLLMSSTRLR
jgi:hypothetical protein